MAFLPHFFRAVVQAFTLPHRRGGSPRRSSAGLSLESRVMLSVATPALVGHTAVGAGSDPAFEAPLSQLAKGDKASVSKGIDYSRLGNAVDALPPAQAIGQGGVALLGGGVDVDVAFRWMIDRMPGKDLSPGNSPGEFAGDFLILRASKSEGYNPYIYDMGGVNSVATLVVSTRSAANHPEVAQIISRAEAIFIAGGDQGDYVERWTNTPLQFALNARIQSGIPVGGTSAGADVLSQFIYSAEVNGVTSDVALANPFSNKVSLARDFVSPQSLPALGGTIVDTHFQVRDRMGRMAAFLARIDVAGWTAAPEQTLGIGLNEQTALLVEPEGLARVVGNSGGTIQPAVDFLRTPADALINCQPKQPLTYDRLEVARVTPGGTFDLSDWGSNWNSPGENTSFFTVTIRNGVLTTGPAATGSGSRRSLTGDIGWSARNSGSQSFSGSFPGTLGTLSGRRLMTVGDVPLATTRNPAATRFRRSGTTGDLLNPMPSPDEWLLA